MDWAVRDVELPQAQKLILIILVKYANKDMTCFPAQETLASNAGMTSRSVRSALTELEKKGLIYREKQYEDGRRKSDKYHINVGGQPVDNS